ncbi:MAG: hypothetical protein AB8B91_13360 [Rubripirellula sp.]
MTGVLASRNTLLYGTSSKQGSASCPPSIGFPLAEQVQTAHDCSESKSIMERPLPESIAHGVFITLQAAPGAVRANFHR